MDEWGHGTFIAGEIAAVLNNNEGIAGLAQVKVMAERCFGEGGDLGGYMDQIANGIRNATDSGADIIIMSFMSFTSSETLYNAIKYAYDNDVVLICGVGNDHINAKTYPAAYEEVIAVTATDEYDNRVSFSNYGDWVELAAPGINIISTWINNTYEKGAGTSYSGPQVAGVAALVMSRYPNLTGDSVRYWIRHTSEDLGEKGFDIDYGYGRINAHAAVNATWLDYDLVAIGLVVPSVVEANASRE